jgi:hypothetical protein
MRLAVEHARNNRTITDAALAQCGLKWNGFATMPKQTGTRAAWEKTEWATRHLQKRLREFATIETP